jgi:thioredoxin reductase
MDQNIEVIIIGGGPAGLSAALVLGRARRRTLVLDHGVYRNAASRAMHGFITREGMSPAEFLRVAHGELARYPSVEIRRAEVSEVGREGEAFTATLAGGTILRARKMILATGVRDELPPVFGAEELYGRYLFHCPYCDGWENQDQPLLVYGRGDDKGAGMALELTQWSRQLVLCTDGPAGISGPMEEKLRRFGIVVDERKLAAFVEEGGAFRARFNDGSFREAKALFFNTRRFQQSKFAVSLDHARVDDEKCGIDKNQQGRSNVRGLYIIGDASGDVLQVVVAAGEGSAAAIALNSELLKDDGIL